ncbi:MAG: glutamine amidotransferase [Candidatus Saccharibacteria bacterium]|nr:glutamine amidotransferase [Candidatus Saccharibacteria bacterium]
MTRVLVWVVMAKPFLILQLRADDIAADNELNAFVRFGGLKPGDFERIRLEQAGVKNVNLDNYSGIIVGGGPSNVSDTFKSPEQIQFETDLYKLFDEIIARDFPYLGACYGLGIFAQFLGARVTKERYSESVGAVTVTLTDEGRHDALTKALPESFRAFVGHKEAVQELPRDAVHLAQSDTCPVQMIRFRNNIYATQFHPELDAEGLAVRIQVYKNAGYFPPEDARALIHSTQDEAVAVPMKILKRFVERYRVK